MNKHAMYKTLHKICVAIDYLKRSVLARTPMAHVVSTMKFLLFMEKPRPLKNIKLEPWKLVVIFIYAFSAPLAVGVLTIPYGWIAEIFAEVGLIVVTVSILHVLYER